MFITSYTADDVTPRRDPWKNVVTIGESCTTNLGWLKPSK